MKRIISVLLALTLIAGLALAEETVAVSGEVVYVNGYEIIIMKAVEKNETAKSTAPAKSVNADNEFDWDMELPEGMELMSLTLDENTAVTIKAGDDVTQAAPSDIAVGDIITASIEGGVAVEVIIERTPVADVPLQEA